MVHFTSPRCHDGVRYFSLLAMLMAILDKSFGALDGYVAGQDYPAYSEVPRGLSFSCNGRPPGYYADPETQCQVWHWCLPNGQKFSFLCPNGTMFNQAVRVCDWFFKVDCQQAPNYYSVNDDLYKDAEGNYIQG